MALGIAIALIGCLLLRSFALASTLTQERPARRRFQTGIAVLAGSIIHLAILHWLALEATGNLPSARMLECRVNLRRAYSSELRFSRLHQRFTLSPAELGLAGRPRNRYAYFLSLEAADSVQPDTDRHGRRQAVTAAHLRLHYPELQLGLVRDGAHFVFACAGNIDSDPALDVWTVASFPRCDSRGYEVAPGMLLHEQDDTTTPL